MALLILRGCQGNQADLYLHRGRPVAMPVVSDDEDSFKSKTTTLAFSSWARRVVFEEMNVIEQITFAPHGRVSSKRRLV